MIRPGLEESMNIEETIKKYLPEEGGPAGVLAESMIYSLMAGGKRIRPSLMYDVYKMFGGEEEVIGPFMAALEMIHTYSLVHDDLPAMDNDTLRRGKPTTWSVYGEDVGILCGDALLTFAFETAAKGFAMTAYPDRAAKAIGILAQKAGIYGMCGGQTVDVINTGKTLTEDLLEYIYRDKTGALLAAALMIGGVLAGAEHIDKLEETGYILGRAFQIQDDILDITSTEEELGKPIGSDERNNKVTYVTLHGLSGAKEEVHALTERVRELIAEMPRDAETLLALVNKLETRTY